MGSWNADCGLSHLPIEEGDRVVGILLAASPWKDRTEANPTSKWKPISGFFRGTYDDYGSIEDIEISPECEQWMRLVLSTLAAPATLDEHDDKDEYPQPEDWKTWPIDQLLMAVERGNVHMRFARIGKEEISLPVCLWMAHEELFNTLMNGVLVRHGETFSTVDELVEDMTVLDLRFYDRHNFDVLCFNDIMDREGKANLFDPAGCDLRRTLAEIVRMVEAMTRCRLYFTEYGGGCQDGILEVRVALHKATTTLINRKLQEQAELYASFNKDEDQKEE